MTRIFLIAALLAGPVLCGGCSQSDDSPESEITALKTNDSQPVDDASNTPVADVTADAADKTEDAVDSDPATADDTAPVTDPAEPVVPQSPDVPDSSPEDSPPSDTPPDVPDEPEEPAPTKLPEDLFKDSKAQPLNESNTVFLDLTGKRLLLKTNVCLTLGQLEMLVCLKQTKEHESILSLDAKAFTIHTGLLALGCKEGSPFRYDPDKEMFHAPQGQPVDIYVHWVDTAGKLHREDARRWVRRSRYRYYEEPFEKLPDGLTLASDGDLRYDDMNHVVFWYGPMSEKQREEHLALCDDEKYQKAIHRFFKESQSRPMTDDWLFVGSHFYDDPDRGRQYLAEGGYVVCVANFSMALLDISGESSAGGNSLTYEAWTERIPPRDSEVLVELVPREETVEKKSEPEATDAQPSPRD